MKRQLFALSLLAAVCGGAAAQSSSVTLFGIIDLGASSIKSGSAGTVRGLTSGAVSTSRVGFRGVEDLGGGLSAGFHLEAGVSSDTGAIGNIDTGAASLTRFFDRRSTVSLFGRFGELRLGHDYNPSTRNTYLFEPYIGTGVGTILNFTFALPSAGLGSGVSVQRSLLRNSNSVAYFLPSGLGGLYGEAMIAAGENGPSGSKYWGGRLGWAAGPVDVSGAYGRAKTLTPDDFEQFNIGASYNLGFLKLLGLYNENRFGVRKQKTTSIGLRLPFGQSELFALYGVNNRSSSAAADATTQFSNTSDSRMLSAGYQYNLSKRTALYAIAARVTNKGNANLSTQYASPAGMLGGETSTGVQAGLTHRF